VSACGHGCEIGNTAYTCERAPHAIDGYDAEHRHAATIGEELAKGTDENDGFGPADVVTWGEDGNGDGQNWEVAWGTVEAYPDGGER
jgi:hypothetical protein